MRTHLPGTSPPAGSDRPEPIVGNDFVETDASDFDLVLSGSASMVLERGSRVFRGRVTAGSQIKIC